MKRSRKIIGLAIAYVLIATPAVAQSIGGSYRLTICDSACAPADSTRVIARGYIVLFADSVPAAVFTDPEWTTIRRRAMLLERGATPNACFVIHSRQKSVNGREFYAGIIPRGTSIWRRENGRIRLMIYRSPDASYELVGELEDGELTGHGLQADRCGGGVESFGYFIAQRIGREDLERCGPIPAM